MTIEVMFFVHVVVVIPAGVLALLTATATLVSAGVVGVLIDVNGDGVLPASLNGTTRYR